MTSSQTPSTAATSSAATPTKPAALTGWRLLALFYDLWPVVALWMVVSAAFTLGYTFLGHHDPHQNIPPFSPLAWLLWLCCWVVAGLYATVSWRRGGQTLGMRPWRLRVMTREGGAPSWSQLWKRYAMGSLSLLVAGMGFWWAWIDRERLAWHDRASGTHLIRLPKQQR
ncbi:RDD family protein [Lysobacter fragariae]